MKKAPEATKSDKKITIFNGGDLSIDYHILEDTEAIKNYNYIVNSNGRSFSQVGHAAFTGSLLRMMYPKRKQPNLEIIDLFVDLKEKNLMDLPSSFSTVHQFSENKAQGTESKPTWRVAQYLHRTKGSKKEIIKDFYKSSKNNLPKPDVIVLSDYNGGFREFNKIWPDILNENNIPPTFLRTCFPFNGSPLHKSLYNKDNANQNLIIVTTIDSIRRCNVKISQGLSWEKTALDLVAAFDNQISYMKKAAFVITTISRFGVFLYQYNNLGGNYYLFYSNDEIEEINDMGFMGSIHGLNTGLMLHIIKEYIDNYKERKTVTTKTIKKGVRKGLRGITNVFSAGYSIEENNDDIYKIPHFPAKALFQSSPKKAIKKNKIPLVNVPSHFKTTTVWSIGNNKLKNKDEHNNILNNIVIYGDIRENLREIPYSNFGDLIIVGKRELEESRAIKKLVTSYIQAGNQKKPLSIAVFGDPGSGKSLTIKKITESILHLNKTILQFNLSQLTSVHALNESFHQIRDATIDGKIVIAFWDEFDTFFENEDFGWVKYFLAPMQDGLFFEGSSSHKIGQSIFFFISSKYNSLKEITNIIEKKTPESDKACSKLKDFTSRLQGHLETPGINPEEGISVISPELKLRRAILLRALLEKHCPSIFQGKKALINKNLISAFMNIQKYEFEARSMEAIVTMSHIDGKNEFLQSCLPANSQLGLHLDEEKFLNLLYS